MNAVATSEVDFIADNGGSGAGSDSDTNSDESTDYYQPISTTDGGGGGGGGENEMNSDGEIEDHHHPHHHELLPNGYAHIENGVSSLDLSSDEEDEVEMNLAMEMERAAREDERRRNAPLTAENADRVMAAMRGISFGGSVPEWAGQVPEVQWVDILRARSGGAGNSSSPVS